jgi:predicted dehydrogenase
MRKQLHYEWHWFWATGNGEVGNNGIHVIDICRWALGQDQTPPRAMSIGGRFAFDDCGETANTQIALLDYQPAPIICEVRDVRAGKDPAGIGKFRNLTSSAGVVIDCEGGYFAGEAPTGAFFDKEGKKIKDFTGDGSPQPLEFLHLSHFAAAVRSRKTSDLAADAVVGHRSTACCHMANTSHRIGKQSAPEEIADTIKASSELSDAFERCREYLRANGVDLGATPATLGPWVTYDSKRERFVDDFAHQANGLSQREYRKPFVVPKIA